MKQFPTVGNVIACAPQGEPDHGEAKQKLRAHAAILADQPGCIYCAGQNVATTIEHMPPISMFEGRQRPKGLEFPACQPCNNGTGYSDLVAAMLSRTWPNSATDAQTGDAKRIFKGIANNLPDVLREMTIGRAGEKLARKRNNITVDARPFRMDGPLLDLCFGEGLTPSLDKRREPHHFYRMAFGNYEIKADFGGQRITDRNSATAFMLTASS